MNETDFLLLAGKCLSGNADAAEQAALEKMLADDAAKASEFRVLKKFWDEHETPNQQYIEESLQKVLYNFQLKVQQFAPRKTNSNSLLQLFVQRWQVAAAVLIIVSGIVVWLAATSKTEVAVPFANLEKKQNSKGTKSTIELADGSKVWLNADSKIQYPLAFDGKTREVYLNGEAFFEVAKDVKKPFIIHLSNGTVRVLGTSFNVRAYDNEAVVETSVATGKVAFIPRYATTKKTSDTLYILPNNKVRFELKKEVVKILNTEATDDKAWTEGKLIFKSMTLKDICTELERNFGKRTVFLDEEAERFVLTGSFQNNTLEEVLYFLTLSKSKKIFYKITGNEVWIATSAGKLQ